MPVAISTKDKTWSKMFPTTFKTEQQSLVFMKKLFAVAISNIVYIRAIFPEHAFFDKILEGIKLKILREDSKCPGATKVISWVRGCFDALDKKFLRAVIIGFYTDPNDPDTVIESYSFKFIYGADGVSMKVKTTNENNVEINEKEPPEKIKKATLSLLRTMILAGSTQNNLPEKVIMTMKLLYYDEVTPEDYQPIGFKNSDYAGFRHETETINAKLGQVDTDYHGFKVVLKTDKTVFTENYEKEKGSNKSFDETNKSIQEINDKEVNEEMEVDIDRNDEFTVRCPCGGNKDDGIMIMCDNCKNWQHSVCFGILNEESVPEIHICDICGDDSDREPTNQQIQSLLIDERQELCLMRRAVYHCRYFDNIDPDQLAEVLAIEVNVAKGIFNNLVSDGILNNPKRRSKAKGRLYKIIDKQNLENVISNKYFLAIQNNISSRKRSNKEISTDKNTIKNDMEVENSPESLISSIPVAKRLRGSVARTPVVSHKD